MSCGSWDPARRPLQVGLLRLCVPLPSHQSCDYTLDPALWPTQVGHEGVRVPQPCHQIRPTPCWTQQHHPGFPVPLPDKIQSSPSSMAHTPTVPSSTHTESAPVALPLSAGVPTDQLANFHPVAGTAPVGIQPRGPSRWTSRGCVSPSLPTEPEKRPRKPNNTIHWQN